MLTCNNLRDIGIDVDSVLTRLGGNEALYLSLCQKFVKDPNYRLVIEANTNKDIVILEIRIHTLKGVAANLGFNKLAAICTTLLDDLRNYNLSSFQQNINNLTYEYDKIMLVLEQKSLDIVP